MISLVGRVIGGYRLEMVMGTGALGETFRAQQLRGGRTVAVKVIHPQLTDPGFRERFQREVGTLQALHHPHLLEVLEFGEEGGQFFIAMTFCVEGSLRTLLQRREELLPLARGLELVRQTADALAFAHGRGVVHRDVKPENLLIGPGDSAAGGGGAGGVKLADAGLTRLVESGSTVGGNMAFGSLAYMSPEQCKGLPLTAGSDIYSLGVVLYEICTGYPPFQAKTLAEALSKHVSTAPPSPRSVLPSLPAEVEAIILRCLAKKSEDRFPSASELSGALRQLAPAAPPPPPAPQRREANPPRIVWRDADRAAGGSATPEQTPEAPPPPAPVDGPKRIRVRLDEGAERVGLDAARAPTIVEPPRVTPPLAPPPPPLAASPPPPPAAVEKQRIKVKLPAESTPVGPTLPDTGRERPQAAESKRIRVALERDALTLVPGQPGVVRVTVANGGRLVDHFPLSVEGVPEGWVKLPDPPQLNPGERTTVALTVTAPRLPTSRAGEYPVVVRARSVENPAESGTAAARWTVLPFAQTALSLSPARARGWRRAAYRVNLRNGGNALARYALSASDDEGSLRYRFGGAEVALDAGEGTELPLGVEAKRRWIGSSETRGFGVRAESLVADAAPPGAPPAGPREPPQVTPAQFVHRAIIPLWLPPLLAVAAIALFMLLRGRGEELLAVKPTRVEVAVGTTARLVAAVTNRNDELLPDQSVVWQSRDTTVATVSDSGVVRGLRTGGTLITAHRGRKTATTEVSVVAARVEALAVTPKRVGLRAGGSALLRATARDANGTVLRRDVTWLSSDPTVATVGGNGRVTAKAAGSATITAQAEAKTATAEVTVAAPVVAEGGGDEDCVDYDPAALKVTADRELGFIVTDGSTNLLTLDNERDARRAQAVATRFRRHCFLGRTNTRPNRSDYVVEYWQGVSGAAPPIGAEDCVRYNPTALRVTEVGSQGFVVTDGRLRELADTRKDAQKIWEMAQRFTMRCAIGLENRRPNQRDYIVEYWK